MNMLTETLVENTVYKYKNKAVILLVNKKLEVHIDKRKKSSSRL